MDLKELKKRFSQLETVERTASELQVIGTKIHWTGTVGASLSFLSSSVTDQVTGNHVFLLEDKEHAAYFLNDLQGLFPDKKNLLFYPASYRTPYELEKTDNANVVARAEVLEKINSQRNNWIVTYPKALFERIPSKQTLAKNTLKLEVGKSYGIELVNEQLLELHFDRVDFVYEPGQFSIRGGIVDVFSYANDDPYRIEFFGDEIESIRTFDASNQLSVREHQFFNIVPNVQGAMARENNVNFFDFLGQDLTVWLQSYSITESTINKEYKRAQEIHSKLPESPVKHSLPSELFLHSAQLLDALKAISVVEFGVEKHFKSNLDIHFEIKPQPSFNKNFGLLVQDLHERKASKFETLIFSNQPKQIERLEQIFHDLDQTIEFTPVHIALHEGFIFDTLKLVCYTDHQLFERYHRFRLKEGFQQAKQALTLKELYNLKSGDYVTHIDHGVGVFSGLETIDVNGKPQEAIRLLYRDNDVLYVGIHSLHRISRFTGKDGTTPSVNKLGTQAWSNLKKKTKTKIKELAFDLIQLYAKRKAQEGFAFTPDSYLQNELEASFMYEDTPDQLRATIAVKEDMESKTPMDRLICGDVGFGKTEIAIRAAFKAVTDGKQVAILVPTTILSMQHFRTFKARLEDFPCSIDYLNRFKSAKETTETVQKLESGKIDILIGTHAIVGKRIKFKDLGLMIIDEEQKFGVAVKDKLKTLRATIDTLTLTATPIPRTLQFSLMGARDLSIINTPPPNRQPVLTEVISFSEERIRDAIAYEVSRGGQVYFVHNRLQNIKEIAGMIQRLCPGIRVAIGHGQMEGKDLERIMFGFIDHQYDVLLATTIIESGIDISNANTILINNAHGFGISDLHQLRGRVGRSNRKGFCYLIAPPQAVITNDARKRLDALVQFSDLGSGFNIAMKDLDIRGAGNLLGGEQSGFIADIGFEMYQKILNEAIDELRESEFKELFSERNTDSFGPFVRDCVFESDLEIRIPDDYVNNVAERLSLYQELDGINDELKLSEFLVELRDRFGPVPHQVNELIESFRLRWLAQEVGIEKLVLKSGKMIGYFISNPQSPFYESDAFTNVLNYVQNNGNNVKLSEKNDKLRIIFEDVKDLNVALKEFRHLAQPLTTSN